MTPVRIESRLTSALAALAALGTLGLLVPAASAQDKPVYRCPGNVYNNTYSTTEAKDKGCRTLEGTPITIIESVKPRGGAPVPPSTASRPDGARVNANEQRARDTDSRRILEGELRKEEAALDAMRKEFNKGEPERRGDERNYQKYLDRVAELKASIARKESDVAALRRELGKLQ